MKIGLISDTHVPSVSKEPAVEVRRAFEGVELILHAGDIYVPSCLDWLERIAPVKAVELGSLAHFNGDSRVSEQCVLEIEGYTIGMVHDFMLPGMGNELRPGVIDKEFSSKNTLPALIEKFFGGAVDTVVFGHTHHAMIEEHNGILFVNPGSPSLPLQMRRLGQVGILELSSAGREARIIELANLS